MTEAEKAAIIALVQRTGWEKFPSGINMSADHLPVFTFAKGYVTGAIVAALEKLLTEYERPKGVTAYDEGFAAGVEHARDRIKDTFLPPKGAPAAEFPEVGEDG